LELTRNIAIARVVHGDTLAQVTTTPTNPTREGEVAGRVKLHYEDVVTPSGRKFGVWVEVDGALESTRDIDVSCTIDGNAVTQIITSPPNPLRVGQVAGRVELHNEDIRAAGGGKFGGASTRIKVGGALESTRDIDVVVGVHSDSEALVGQISAYAGRIIQLIVTDNPDQCHNYAQDALETQHR